MKKLIRCPDCEERGIKQNLAEVLESGCISIQRIRRGRKTGDNYIDHTIIGGTSIFILCGNCGNKVFVRN